MKDFELTLIKNKDFIKAVALHGLSPQKGNDIVHEVFDAYKNIDNTAEVLAECATCDNIYRNSFKIIYAFCESVNWFEIIEIKNKKK